MNLLTLAVGCAGFLGLLIGLVDDGFGIHNACIIAVQSGSVYKAQRLNALIINQAVFL